MRVAIDDSKTPERVKTIDITQKESQGRQVVLSLSKDKLGQIKSGNYLEGMVSIEVSVTCLEPMPKCIGSIYHYSPKITSKLILASGQAKTQGYQLGQAKTITCSQKLPHRNHHCVISIRVNNKIAKDLPGHHLNLVMSAFHPSARSNNKLVIGADGNSGISQGKASISAAVFERDPQTYSRQRLSTSKPLRQTIPVTSNNKSSTDKFVAYSIRLNQLQKGEHLVVDSKLKTKIDHLPYSVLNQTQLIISEKPNSTDFYGLPVQVVTNNGKITNANGFNCTRRESDFKSPCPNEKAGAARIIYNSRTQPRNNTGPWKPLYLNLVISAKNVYGGSYSSGDVMKVDGGYLRVTRYAPQHR
jgi:hypothetical protein